MIHRSTLAIVLVGLMAVLAAPSTAAAKAPHRYSPRHGAKCHKGYKRVIRHRRHHHTKVFCVKRARKHKAAPAPTAPAPTTQKVKLHAHLDPTYTRDPLNPFEVTYAYSASASAQTFSAQSVALTAEEPTPLPSGVLALYSDGKLACAMNVGSGVEESQCPVEYEALGQHTVTTIYSSGEQSATETETENIAPLGTTTTLSVSYSSETPVEVGIASGLFRIGALTITIGSSPSSVTPRLGCTGGSVEHLTPSGCYEVIEGAPQYVYRQDNGICTGGIWISKEHPEPGESGGAGKVQGERFSAADLEAGTYHLRASIPTGNGYSGSEATAPLQFVPEATPDC